MAVFIFGAGATRGASFVDFDSNPCLPFLDSDFFTQLQRIKSDKHRVTVDHVIKDTTDLFGVNFRVTMETLFTTLEHTARMIETAGENRDFKKTELRQKRERLKQAIAAVLEEALCNGAHRAGECTFHDNIVTGLRPGDELISFNYDCLLDDSLRRKGSGKWNPRYGYGFWLSKRGSLSGYQHWQPDGAQVDANKSCHLYKLHGSLHFAVSARKSPTVDTQIHDVKLKQRPYTKQSSSMRFEIIPPESNKGYDKGVFKKLWGRASEVLHKAETLVFIGYSFPTADSHANALFRISVRQKGIRNLVIVNPDREARRRTREVLGRGLDGITRVQVFDTFKEFSAVPRRIWDR